MPETKKLKDLTKEELKRCGWIERIAYRDDTDWMMYNFENENFEKIKNLHGDKYDQIDVTLGKKWFAMYLEAIGSIFLIDIAKMDVGKDQAEATKEISEFTQKVIDTGKFIFVVARAETSYFSLVKLAADGKIEVLKDEDASGNKEMRDMIFCKAGDKTNLEEQMQKYKEKIKEFEEGKDEYKKRKTATLKGCIARLEAEIGEGELRGIMEH